MRFQSDTATIGFVCAMPLELRPLVRKLSLRKARVDGVPVRRGTFGGREVVAIVTGMGTELAAAGTERLLDAVHVDWIGVVGITGAVDNVTPIGSLVEAEAVVDSTTGAEHRPAPLGEGPADGQMARGKMAHGKIWTSDVLLTDREAIARLRALGVVSLDMETAAIARVCEGRGVPWSVFRVISDRATDGSVDEEVFHLSNQDGTPNGRAVARYLLKHPGRIPSMIRLARQAKLATNAAAEAAIRAFSRT